MKQLHKQTLRYYWQQAKKYPKYLVGILVGEIGGICGDLINPFIYKSIIDLVTQGSADYKQIFTLLTILLVSELILGNFWRLAGFAGIKLQANVVTDIINSAFDYLHKHSYNFFSGSFTGALVKKVNRFVSAFESIADRAGWSLIPLTIRTTLVLGILIITDWRISLIFFLWLVIFFTSLRSFLNWHTKFDTALAKQNTTVSAQLADSISNFENVKLFGNLKYEKRRFFAETKDMAQKMRKSWNTNEWFYAVQTALMAIGEFTIMFVTLKLWQHQQISIGTVVLVQAYIAQIMFRIWDLSHIFKDIYSNLSNAEEMMTIFNRKHEIADTPGAKRIKINKGNITFQNVTYVYEQIQPVFKDLNINIKDHEKVALVGSSGAGKSTLVKLLLRFYDIQKGQILIDGQDITQFSQESLRQQIAFVPQDPVMFHRSIMENIRYGRLNATDEEVIKAAKLARCHQFIIKNPEGYATKVGERGIKLSGGERQRIAIARAILKNAPILILDEATSSLDSRSEKLIQEALHVLMRNKTVIAIAHRLSTVREMDRIIVLEDGKILEEGKHEDLLKMDEHYAELWKLQSGN